MTAFLISRSLFQRMVDAVYATVDEDEEFLYAEINGTRYRALKAVS